jgi:adenosylcobinamide-GDP ribazoletransferase
MYHGAPEKKLEIMHDQQIGTGGLTLALIVILATTFSIAQLNQSFIVQSLVISEVSAKLSMVLMAWVGKSARMGMNTYFVNAMHSQHRNIHLIVALSIAFSIATLFLRVVGFTVVVVGLATALVLVGISNRHFGGVTGDVFGAGNELARLASLIAISVMTKWM